MSTNETYLAVFLGSKTSPRMKAWMALPEAERRAKEQQGMAAWKAWVAAQPSPHCAFANKPLNSGAVETARANASMSGSSRCSGMLGINS